MDASATPLIPGSVSLEAGPAIGFKEWALVCRSMLAGETSVIFRKGGIAEGRQGFRFKHDQFFLFPTFFHEQLQCVRVDDTVSLEAQPASVTIQAWVSVEFTVWVEDLTRVEPLRPLHILTGQVLQQRADYSEPKGLHLAFVRAYRLPEPWVFPYQRSFGGCRSWVNLPDLPAALPAMAVLSDAEQARRRDLVRSSV
ncbi:MAG: DUF1802 family protein [Verrucomicrobia bacterium]|nr:DUF1802 family protein [Verrucomicrobiota bacterium]